MLERVQGQLEAIYGIECEHQVRDFLVDLPTAQRLGATGRADEELLVHEHPDGLDLALYLEPGLLARVGGFEHQPGELLGAQLPGFCEVAEGVSHFVYLTHTARQERTVSLLELEAQAEVDKFALCTLLRWGSEAVAFTAQLMERLFDRVRLRAGLEAAERWRYTEASRVAKRYCTRLQKHVRAGRLEGLLAELRHGYRLGAEAKLAYFAR